MLPASAGMVRNPAAARGDQTLCTAPRTRGDGPLNRDDLRMLPGSFGDRSHRPASSGRRGGFVVSAVAMLPVRHDGAMDIDLRDMYIANLRADLHRAADDLTRRPAQVRRNDEQ